MLTNLIRKIIGILRRRLPGLQHAIASPERSLEDEYLRTVAADPELSLEQKVRYWRREGFIFSDLVQDALPVGSRLVVLDVGAREAFLDPRWRGFKRTRIEFLGFEADAAEAERLNEEAKSRGAQCRYFGIGVWSEKGEKLFYETGSPGGSSFYQPNGPLVNRWKFESETQTMLGADLLRVAKTRRVMTDTLDAILAANTAVPRADFLKLNIQGGELPVLKGATSALNDALGVQTEVSFVESYVGRPMFSDVDAYLREQGFEFFDFVAPHYMGRVRSPLTARQLPGLFGLYGQNVEAHVLYLRDPIRLSEKRPEWVEALSEERALKLVAIAETYHQVEFAVELLFWLEEHFRGLGNAAAAETVAELRRLGLKRHDSYMRWHSERFDAMVREPAN